MLVYPSGIDLSSRTLRHRSGLLARHRHRHRHRIGSRWRRLTCGRQALLVLAHLRCDDTYARLAAGFRIGIATAYRYIREAVDVLAALALARRRVNVLWALLRDGRCYELTPPTALAA